MTLVHCPADQAAIRYRFETEDDVAAREALLDDTMGPIRFKRSSERIREGRIPAIALVATDAEGALVGTVRLWHAKACGASGILMLGPLAVDPSVRGQRIGANLMDMAIAHAMALGYTAIVLVGDEAWYSRFGFRARHAHRLSMPGPFERHRMLGLPLVDGALDRAHGVLRASGPALSIDIGLVRAA